MRRKTLRRELLAMAIEVTQEDRERVDEICNPRDDPHLYNILGKMFARHRQAAYAKGYRAAHMEILIKDSGDLICPHSESGSQSQRAKSCRNGIS